MYTQLNVKISEPRIEKKKKKFPCRNWAQQFRILRFEFAAKQIFNRICNADRATAKNLYARIYVRVTEVFWTRRRCRPFGLELFARITDRELSVLSGEEEQPVEHFRINAVLSNWFLIWPQTRPVRAAQSVSVVFAPSGPRNGPTNKSTQRGSSFHGRGKSEGTKLVKQRRVDSPHLSPGNDEEEIFFVARFFLWKFPCQIVLLHIC